MELHMLRWIVVQLKVKKDTGFQKINVIAVYRTNDSTAQTIFQNITSIPISKFQMESFPKRALKIFYIKRVRKFSKKNKTWVKHSLFSFFFSKTKYMKAAIKMRLDLLFFISRGQKHHGRIEI